MSYKSSDIEYDLMVLNYMLKHHVEYAFIEIETCQDCFLQELKGESIQELIIKIDKIYSEISKYKGKIDLYLSIGDKNLEVYHIQSDIHGVNTTTIKYLKKKYRLRCSFIIRYSVGGTVYESSSEDIFASIKDAKETVQYISSILVKNKDADKNSIEVEYYIV